MKRHLAAARESVACLPDSKERHAALQSICRAQEQAKGLPDDPGAHQAATEALIQSLESRLALAENSEKYLLDACRNLQERVAELMGLKRETS